MAGTLTTRRTEMWHSCREIAATILPSPSGPITRALGWCIVTLPGTQVLVRLSLVGDIVPSNAWIGLALQMIVPPDNIDSTIGEQVIANANQLCEAWDEFGDTVDGSGI